MKQPGEDRIVLQQEQIPERNPQMRPKQSNYSMVSQVSFNGEPKKQKSKSFNRKQNDSQQQTLSIIKIYRELQYTPQIRNALKKFCYLDKEKLLKLSVNELRQLCERELKRIDLVRRNNVEVQRLLSQQEIQDTDNELSLVAITTQVKVLSEFRDELKMQQSNSSQSIAKTRLRQYENILLDTEKSDQLIKNFINTNLKLPEPSDISILDCKKFFKKQAYQMSQSSDRIVLSRRTLCEIIIFLCRLLEGEILAFDDIYEYQNQSFNSVQYGDQNHKVFMQSRTIRNNQIIVQNLDQSFSDNNSQKSENSNLNHNNLKNNAKTYQSYSNDDLGKKVYELAGICEQIPQLEAFTRTLKFSKITLQNRQSFFRIVDVIIALHHKIGYLSRNKPTLLRQIQHIEKDLSQVYETIREFVASLLNDIPQFGELRFKSQDDSKHQLTQTLSFLRKDMKKLADIILEQNKAQNQLYEKLQFMRVLIQTFCQSINQADEGIWQDYVNKLSAKNLSEQETQIVNWLSDCYNTIYTEIKLGQRHQQQLETERNLQAEVHTLLNDYERLRAEHQQLQNKYNSLLQHRDDLLYDIEQRDKIISNLTAMKISSQKRERSLRDQLIQAQDDANRWEHDLTVLEEQLEIMSIQNQNKVNQLHYEHQNQVKQLVDKIAALQRAKMDILGKYEEECSKSIRLLQQGNYSNVEVQGLKDRLDKKVRQYDDERKKQREAINNLEKQLQQLKDEKNLLQNKLQMAEKNKNKLMDKLQQVNGKYSVNVKDFENKYENEIVDMKQAQYRLEKELQKQKRSKGLLSDEVEQLKAEHLAQVKVSNQYRHKVIQMNSLQNEYDSLAKQYERLVENFHKLQTNNENYIKKIHQLTSKQQELLELLARQRDLTKKLDRKVKDLENKLEDLLNSHDRTDIDLKQQHKLNKALQKKVSQYESEIQSLQSTINNKDKQHSLLINKYELKYNQLNQQLQSEIEALRKKNQEIEGENEKNSRQLKGLQRQLREQIDNIEQNDLEWNKLKGQLERRLKEKDEERTLLEEKNRQLDEQVYNQSILLQQIRSEKNLLQVKLIQLQTSQKENAQLRKKMHIKEQSEEKFKDKIEKLQNQVQRLYEEIQKLKQLMKQKDREIQLNQLNYSRRQQKDDSEQKDRKQKLYESKSQEITHFKQQILIEKNLIVTENNKLHQENNDLQDEIAKLKTLNQLLQKNVKKLENTSTQANEDFLHTQNNLKQSIAKHLFTITSLQTQLTGINAEKQMLKRDYDELQRKLQAKCKLLSQRDNLLFEKQLQKNNSDKLLKQLKFKISQLEGNIEELNTVIQKLKSSRIKSLQQQVMELGGLLAEWKKKQEQSRCALNDLQSQLQKARRDSAKKIEALKGQKLQLEQETQNQIKKLVAQHQLELSSVQTRARKQTEHQFNQLLIKQKETFNNLTIQKIEELGQMQRKYEKLIKEQRSDRSTLQQDYNKLERDYHDLKRNSLNTSKVTLEEVENNTAQEQLHKLKFQHESLNRELTRLQLQNARLTAQNSSFRQQNSTLLSKSVETEHMLSIMTSKLNLVTQTLQGTKKSLEQLSKVELQKLNLERELEKLKTKTANDQSKINDYKGTLQQMDSKICDLEGKLQGWRNKQFQWTRNNNQSTERFRVLTNQSNDMSQKLQEMKQKLTDMTNKLADKSQKLQTVETQLQAAIQKVKQKQIQLQSTKQHLQNQITSLQEQLTRKSTAHTMLERQQRQLAEQSEEKQSALKQEADRHLRKARQLQIELNQYKKNSHQATHLIQQLSKTKNYALQMEDRTARLETELAKIKGDKLAIERQNDLLQKQLDALNADRNNYNTQLVDLQRQNNKLLTQNQQLSAQLPPLLEQIKRQKQLTLNQIKRLEQSLRTEFQQEKRSILTDCQETITSVNAEVRKQESRANELNLKCNRLLQQIEEQLRVIELLRKQNMQLSDHCKKYEERIKILETDHNVKGQSSIQIQYKYQNAQNEKALLQQTNQNLQSQLQRLINQQRKLRERVAQLQSQLQSHSRQISSWQQRFGQLKSQNQKKNDEFNHLQQKYSQISQDLQKSGRQNMTLNQAVLQKTREKQQLKTQLVNFQQNVTSSNQELQRLRKQNSELQQQLQDKCRQADSLRFQVGSSDNQLTNENNQLIQIKVNLQRQLTILANQFRVLQQRLVQAQTYIQWSDNNRKELQERLTQSVRQLQALQIQTKTLQNNLFQTQGNKNRIQYQSKTLSTQNSSLTRRVSQLESYLKDLQNRQKLNVQQKSTQESSEIQRLMAELALTRQEVLRLHEVIKTKQQDFEKQILRLTEEKAAIWKDNQTIALQCQSLRTRLGQLQRSNQSTQQQLTRERQQKENQNHQITNLHNQITNLNKGITNLNNEITNLRNNLASKQQQYSRVNQLLIDSQRKEQQLMRDLQQSQQKQQQLTRTLISQQAEVRRVCQQNEGFKHRLSLFCQQDEQLKLSQSRLKEHTDSLSGEIARLQSQLAIIKMEYSRIHSEHSKLNQQLQTITQQKSSLNSQLTTLRQEAEHYRRQCSLKDQNIFQLNNQLERYSNEINTQQALSSSRKQDLEKGNIQLQNLRTMVYRLERDIQNLNSHLDSKDRIINQMKANVNKGNQIMEHADKQLKKIFQQKNKLNSIIQQLTTEKENHVRIIKTKQSQTTTLKQTIAILQTNITQLKTEIQNLSEQNQSALTHSRSSINLVTKSYSYQGGQVTVAQLNRLQQENRRLIKEIQNRDHTIQKNILEIQKLAKEIKMLKEQIHLLSEGKTINLKGYTRVTNPNDTSLNTKGIVYTEYDVKELKAKIEVLQKGLARYQDRQTQLLRQIEKYKFRQRHYVQQITVLQESAGQQHMKQSQPLAQIPCLNSPTKKTSFDQSYSNHPQSSTYRLQTGIQVTQRTINMTKKQVKTSEKYFLRVEGEQLRTIIERLSSGQQIMSGKIDEILNSSQKAARQSLQLVLTNNQFNMSTVVINEIRELIHQNKALIQTLRSLKQYRQDVTLLLQEYIDPELLTQFVYRILTYFSQVSDQSPEGRQIRNQLNMIRKNNVGGYYFTVLEEYTKYILQNNSIQIYKEELRQKARQLINFREKFQLLIDSKLDQNDKLLNKSDSRNSLINRSRTKYMGSSRAKSGSQISREDNSRIKEYIPTGNKMTIPITQNILPNPIHLLNGANQHNYSPNLNMSPMLITVNQTDRPRTSSRITYTPYNKQLMAQVSTPTQSGNQSRVHQVSHTSNSTSHMENSYTTVNSSSINVVRSSFEKK